MFQVLEKLGRQSRGNQTLKGTRIMLKDQQKIQIMTPIFSDFLDEPGMPKIINMFLDEIPYKETLSAVPGFPKKPLQPFAFIARH